MSLLSIAVLVMIVAAIIMLVKSKSLPMQFLRVLHFSAVFMIFCIFPEFTQFLHRMLYTEWIHVAFANWFGVAGIAQTGGQIIAMVLIIAILFLVCWGLWRLVLLVARRGNNKWAAYFIIVVMFFSTVYAEFANDIFSFEDKSYFMRFKVMSNARFPVFPTKVTYYSDGNPESEKCIADMCGIFTNEDEHTKLRLLNDDTVAIWKSADGKGRSDESKLIIE